jgi:hypothetical protein
MDEEDGPMGQTVADLDACLAKAGNPAQRNKCMKDFTDSGGLQKGGKVFTDQQGAQLATTQDGGKVFTPKA